MSLRPDESCAATFGHRAAMAVAMIAVTALVSACGASAASAQELFGNGTWQLVSSSVDGEPITVPEGSRVTVVLSDDGTQIGGTAACNGYGATDPHCA